ncbi:hypothetical protein GCM10009780_57860 [Actinomadura alba]
MVRDEDLVAPDQRGAAGGRLDDDGVTMAREHPLELRLLIEHALNVPAPAPKVIVVSGRIRPRRA